HHTSISLSRSYTCYTQSVTTLTRVCPFCIIRPRTPSTTLFPYTTLFRSYVHESMEDYLSPAFYLTPPLDTGSPNVIYINRSGRNPNLELFTTLAHEGFPGHLYQTVYFASCRPSDIRYLINCSGYVEGWATYIESYAFQYATAYLDDEAAADLTALSRLNRS